MLGIRVLFVMAWLVLAAPAWAGDVARLDAQNGFRDAHFGANASRRRAIDFDARRGHAQAYFLAVT